MNLDKVKDTIFDAVDALEPPPQVFREALDAFLDRLEVHYEAEDSSVALGVIKGIRWLTKTPDDIGGDPD